MRASLCQARGHRHTVTHKTFVRARVASCHHIAGAGAGAAAATAAAAYRASHPPVQSAVSTLLCIKLPARAHCSSSSGDLMRKCTRTRRWHKPKRKTQSPHFGSPRTQSAYLCTLATRVSVSWRWLLRPHTPHYPLPSREYATETPMLRRADEFDSSFIFCDVRLAQRCATRTDAIKLTGSAWHDALFLLYTGSHVVKGRVKSRCPGWDGRIAAQRALIGSTHPAGYLFDEALFVFGAFLFRVSCVCNNFTRTCALCAFVMSPRL